MLGLATSPDCMQLNLQYKYSIRIRVHVCMQKECLFVFVLYVLCMFFVYVFFCVLHVYVLVNLCVYFLVKCLRNEDKGIIFS